MGDFVGVSAGFAGGRPHRKRSRRTPSKGVFYIVNDRGRYEVIVPPAGALVEFLPEDYDIITLGGAEYYRVDDTVYRTVLVGGRPYLEVLGQMYGSMARKYNSYYSYY